MAEVPKIAQKAVDNEIQRPTQTIGEAQPRTTQKTVQRPQPITQEQVAQVPQVDHHVDVPGQRTAEVPQAQSDDGEAESARWPGRPPDHRVGEAQKVGEEATAECRTVAAGAGNAPDRSEERRGGKGWRSRWTQEH